MRFLAIIVLALVTHLAIAQDEQAVPVSESHYAEEWKSYQPDAKKSAGRVEYAGVRFVSPQEVFEKNTSPEDVAKIIGFIQKILTNESEGHEEGGEIVLHIKLKNDDIPAFKVNHRGELTQEYIGKFYKALSAIEYKTKENPVVLQVRYLVKNA